jgi:hypothetical protein
VVSLTPFPETNREYEYLIRLPVGADQAAIYWYYGVESSHRLLYRSGLVQIVHGTIRTEMYFAWPGDYILVVVSDVDGKLIKQRFRYHVRNEYLR